MSAVLPEGVTVYRGARKYEGELPDGIVSDESLRNIPGVTSITTSAPPPTSKAPKQG